MKQLSVTISLQCHPVSYSSRLTIPQVSYPSSPAAASLRDYITRKKQAACRSWTPRRCDENNRPDRVGDDANPRDVQLEAIFILLPPTAPTPASLIKMYSILNLRKRLLQRCQKWDSINTKKKSMIQITFVKWWIYVWRGYGTLSFAWNTQVINIIRCTMFTRFFAKRWTGSIRSNTATPYSSWHRRCSSQVVNITRRTCTVTAKAFCQQQKYSKLSTDDCCSVSRLVTRLLRIRDVVSHPVWPDQHLEYCTPSERRLFRIARLIVRRLGWTPMAPMTRPSRTTASIN